jgi:hypothetical protein
MHACEMQACKRYTPVRCTPVRCTPVRCTPVRCTLMRYIPMRCIPVILIFGNFDLSLTAPMSCRTSRHTTVLGGMRWCVMVPPNDSAIYFHRPWRRPGQLPHPSGSHLRVYRLPFLHRFNGHTSSSPSIHRLTQSN